MTIVTSANSSGRVILRVANITAFIATFIVNMLASFAGLNGRATGQISDLYPALFTPAGYVFIIWSVIYGLLVFTVYQALPRNKNKAFVGQVGYLFILSCIANIAWLFLWHWLYPVLSLIPMFILLGTLIAIYLRLNIGRSDAPMSEKLAVRLAFSVYLGWITVAPIADVAAALVSVGWNGGVINPVIWTNIKLIIALAITLLVLFTKADIGYGLVIVWALSGIVAKNAAEQSIVYTAEASMAIIALMFVWIAYGLLSTRGVEKPKYTLVKQTRNYEIRQYDDLIVAETDVSGDFGQSLRSGFEVLANYIFGNNAKREPISMTAPVTLERQSKSEKIAMTAPVTQELRGPI